MKNLILCMLIVFICSPIACLQANQPIKKVLLVTAMDTEAKPIITALHLQAAAELFSGLPMRGYKGKYGATEIFLIMNGTDPKHKVQNIGTQPATLATYLGIQHFHPDLVISIGTAGGIKENGAKINDIFISQNIYFYDRRNSMAGYKEYGLGAYPSFSLDHIANKMKFKKGNICTGDSYDLSTTDRDMILKNKCVAVDMEAAGVAWVSMLMQTPMIAIKGVDDMSGPDSAQEYAENSACLHSKLGGTIKEFLTHLSA